MKLVGPVVNNKKLEYRRPKPNPAASNWRRKVQEIGLQISEGSSLILHMSDFPAGGRDEGGRQDRSGGGEGTISVEGPSYSLGGEKG